MGFFEDLINNWRDLTENGPSSTVDTPTTQREQLDNIIEPDYLSQTYLDSGMTADDFLSDPNLTDSPFSPGWDFFANGPTATAPDGSKIHIQPEYTTDSDGNQNLVGWSPSLSNEYENAYGWRPGDVDNMPQGSLADKGYYVYQDANDGTYRYGSTDLDKAPIKGGIAYKGMPMLENPTDFDYDAYETLMSDDFQNMMQDYGFEDFGADINTLRSNPDLIDPWIYFMSEMRPKGWYEDTFTDQRFLDDAGEFSKERYGDWVRENANLRKLLMGQASDEGRDWMTSGGVGNSALLAALANGLDNVWLGMDQNDMPDNIMQLYLEAADNNLLYSNESDNSIFLEDPTTGLPQDMGLARDENGIFYAAFKDGSEASNKILNDYIRKNYIQDALTNQALDEQYGVYTPSISELNQAAKILGQPELYYDWAEGEPDEIIDPAVYFGGEAEQYDPMRWIGTYNQLFNNENRDFNLGATAYPTNENLRTFYTNRD